MADWKRIENNIYFCGDAARRKPYLWKQSIDGVAYREFFFDLKAARNARKAKLASVNKYASLAHEFDKAAFVEYRAAKDRLPPHVSLSQVVDEWLERNESLARPGVSVAEAYDLFLMSKKEERVRLRKRPLSREHLSDLRWRARMMLSVYGRAPVTAISGRQLLELYADPSQAGRTVLNKHNTLKIFFNWCVDNRILNRSPYSDVGDDLLPDKGESIKHPMRLENVVALFAFFEEHYPQYCLWLAIRFFLGMRTKESQRFRPEWILRERKIVRIPGWEDGVAGSKTRDAWARYDVPGNFWAWYDAFPPDTGRAFVAFPYCQIWRVIRKGLIEEGIIREWASNCARDSFCTFNFSADMDPRKLAAWMKHRNPDTMFRSYLGCLRPRWEGRAYGGIYPGARLVSSRGRCR